jgi:hypothetical protein
LGFARKRQERRTVRPGIESLEDRAVPAVYKATDVGKLIQDVAAVSNTSGPNTIILEGRAYRSLTSPLVIQNAGNLTIEGSVGKKGTASQLTGGVSSSIFEIEGGNVTISGVAMTGVGIVAQGGIIHAINTNLTLEKSTVTSGQATQAGGGIFLDGGSLNVNDCTISNNDVAGPGGSVGGGIAAFNANVTITHSKININTATSINNMNPTVPALNAGGGIYAQGGTLNITGTSLSFDKVSSSTNGTDAGAFGGGIATNNTVVTVQRARILNNTLYTIASQSNQTLGSAAYATGGSLSISGSILSNNLPSGTAEVVAQQGAAVVLAQSTVEGVDLPARYTLGPNGFTPET